MAGKKHVSEIRTNNHQKRTRGSILDYFSSIADDNEPKQIRSSTLLLKQLKNYDENEVDELKYALERLIRGLGSSKNSARIGFYSTLVALLNLFPIKIEQVFECIQKQLQIGGNVSKSEIGEVYTGQILTCGAIIRSGMFPKATSEEQENILKMLLSGGTKRSYLTLAASSFIAELLLRVGESQFKVVWSTLKVEILKPWSEQTVDGLYLLILIQSRFGQVLKGSDVKKVLGKHTVVCEENVKAICDVLMNISSVSALKHPVYQVIASKISEFNLVLPFIAELDHQLVRTNRNKLLAVSLIIRNLLPHLSDPTLIPLILTKNFIKQLLYYFGTYHTSNYDKEFQIESTKLFTALIEHLESSSIDDTTKINVLKILLFYPGTFMIENITKSKILQQIVCTLTVDGVKKLNKLYKDVLTGKKEKVVEEERIEHWLNSERVYAAQLLTKLMSHPTVQNELEWKLKNLKLLMNMGIVKHQKYNNVGIELANSLREIFFRALDQNFLKLENMCTVLLELTNYLQSIDETLRVQLSTEENDLLQQTYAITAKLESKKAKHKYAVVFQILFLHMGLQLFGDKDLAIASIRELIMCYERVKQNRKNKREGKGNPNDPEWIEVVIDLFLNLLSHNSHLLRNIIGCVFPYLCKYMTASSIHQILSVLDPKNETNPLSRVDESDSDESDVNVGDDDGSDDETDEQETESENEENETVNDKLRMAVQQALGTNGNQTDEESIDLEDMSETEGTTLDEALAQAFKQFKPNLGRTDKRKQNKDEQTLTHFRVRVLDLIDAYINSEPSMLSCLEIMLPLLQTFEFTIKDEHQKPLQMRVNHSLRTLTSLKKFRNFDGITETVLEDLLNSLLDKGTKSAMIIQDMTNQISGCCIFIVKCSQILCGAQDVPDKTKKKLKKGIIRIFTNALHTYFHQRDCLIPYYLFKCIFQLNWDGNLALVPLLLEFTLNDTIRPFRKSQGLELLKIFYLNRRTQTDEDAFRASLSEHEKLFHHKVVDILSEFCEKPTKERFLYHLFNLLKAMASHPLKNNEVDWKLIGEKVRECRSHVVLSNDAKVAYNKLCGQLKISNIVRMKNQVVRMVERDDQSEEGGDVLNKQQKQKRRASHNANKSKKEARELRCQQMSEGLSTSVLFSDVNLESNHKQSNGLENSVDDRGRIKKSKKHKMDSSSEQTASKKRKSS